MNRIRDFVRENLVDASHRERVRKDAENLGLPYATGVRTLYKYRSLMAQSRDYTIDIIENCRLYFPRPDQLNDPFDCAPRFKLDGDPNDEKFIKSLLDREAEMAKGKPPDYLERLRNTEGVPAEKLPAALELRMRKELEDNTRVLSLSATSRHPLLWSHYASDHTGVCFHFSAEPGLLFGLARKVTYRKHRPPILLNAQAVNERDVELMTLVKARFWTYEHEYRILGLEGKSLAEGYQFDGNGRVKFEPHLLAGITLGMRTSDRDRNEFLSRARSFNPAVPVWQAKMHSDLFRMETEQIL